MVKEYDEEAQRRASEIGLRIVMKVKREDSVCEWCGANWTKGETCNELDHYTNR